jgi:VCBS repeat-containing protein
LGGISDSATVTFKSQHDGTVTGSSTLTTTANSVAPVASDDPYDAAEDLPLEVSTPGVLENDDDANCTPLTVSHHTLPAHGMVMLDPDGSFTYTPTHNFDGIDTFTYHATDGVLTDTATVSITVVEAGDNPIVSIEEIQDVNEGELVSFTGSFDDPQPQSLLAEESIHWDFGDGNTATGILTPTHTYLDNDEYTVTLTVTDTEGDVGQDWLPVTVLNIPPLVYAGPDQSAAPGEVLSFQGSYTDTISDTLTIRWDLSDGSPPIHGTDTFNHAFVAAGNYTVTLNVTDDDGGLGTDSAIVTVRYKVYLPLILRSQGP